MLTVASSHPVAHRRPPLREDVPIAGRESVKPQGEQLVVPNFTLERAIQQGRMRQDAAIDAEQVYLLSTTDCEEQAKQKN